MIAVALSLLLTYTPQEAQALFGEANDAYHREEYAAAIEKYQRLLASGQGGPDVLFNLGTAHLATGELGPAVLYLTRASRLSHDDDVAAQLAVAQLRLPDQVVGASETQPFLERVARAVDDRLMGYAFLGAWWVAFVLLFLFVRAEPGRRWVLGLITSITFAGAVVLGAIVGVHAYVSTSVQEAVVIAETAPARDGPRATGKVSFEVHAGLLVRVMEDDGRFVRIRLPNALEGWIEKAQVTAL